MNSQDQPLSTVSITFRCTPELKAKIEQAAAWDRRKTSSWIVTKLQDIILAEHRQQATERQKAEEQAVSQWLEKKIG